MRATLLSGVLLLVMEGIAQEWCTSGARWRTRTAGFQSVVFSDMTCLGDTLVDGYQAYRIRTISSGYNGPIPISEETISYIVVDQDVLWYRNSTGVLDTLTWFGAEVGDHWKFGPTVGGTADTLRANVTAVGTRSFGGVPLRYVVVDQVGGSGNLERIRRTSAWDLSFPAGSTRSFAMVPWKPHARNFCATRMMK